MSMDRLFEVAAESTRAHHAATRRMDAMERRFESLEIALNERMGKLEEQMGTTNANLASLITEVQRTNSILQADFDDRKETARVKAAADEEARRQDAALRRENRDLFKVVGQEVWAIFKQPMGYLAVATVGYLIYTYLMYPGVALP